MTETTITAIVGGIVTIALAAIAAYSARTSRLAQETKHVAEATEGKADELIVAAKEIHTLTNSTLSAVTAQRDSLLEQNKRLEAIVAKLLNGKPKM